MSIREAKKEDCREILKLLKELADFNKMSDAVKNSLEDLERDGFETHPPLFKGIVAVDNNKVIGVAVYSYCYSPWRGPSMVLNNLYVIPEYRNKGIGSRLFDAVAKKAADENCCRLQIRVVNTNSVQDMYKRKGATDATKAYGWHYLILENEALNKYRSFS